MRASRLLFVLFVSVVPAGAAYPPAADVPCDDPVERLEAYMLAATAFLAVEQVLALSKIADDDRRSLAMTYYLRAGRSIASRWSWTSEQIRRYEKSKPYAAARAEIDKVAAQFAVQNPDYTLFANTRVRSLEEQLTLWATVSSVGDAASELRQAALAALKQPSYGTIPDRASAERFRDFLTGWRSSRRTTIVAPGLSLHGRARAYDFEIRDEDGQTIAGTETSSIESVWVEQGWADKLAQAVHSASGRFKGPLLDPNEPWHYEYDADSTASPKLPTVAGSSPSPPATPATKPPTQVSSTKATTEASTNAATEASPTTAAKVPAKTASKAETKPATKAPAKAETKPAMKAPAKAATKASTKASTKATTKPPPRRSTKR